MFINEKFIIVHIPRTAGTSIRSFLENNFSQDSYSIDWIIYKSNLNKHGYKILDNGFKKERLETFKNIDRIHYTTEEILTHHRKLSDREFVCIVRNPWDWHVSIYEYFRNHLLNIFHTRFIDFNEYINWLKNYEYSITTENLLNKYFSYNQIDWLTDWRGNIKVDTIIKYENIEDFNLFLNKQGNTGNIPHLNKSDRKNYREYYTEESMNFIKEKHRKDIEMFNYNF